MKKFVVYEEKVLPYAGMPICNVLLNWARGYVKEKDATCVPVLTRFINHIGTITTRDFQIQAEDLYDKVEPYIKVDDNMILTVLWNYGSHFLNILHPEYQEGALKDAVDVEVIQDFLNDFAMKNQIEFIFTKDDLFKRIYELRDKENGDREFVKVANQDKFCD